MASWMISALRSGGPIYMDCQEFHSTGDNTPWDFMPTKDNKDGKEEWFPNFWDKKAFLEYENIVELGKRYPEKVKEIIGEYKVAYTPKDDKGNFIFGIKGDKIPEWAKGGKFCILKVT